MKVIICIVGIIILVSCSTNNKNKTELVIKNELKEKTCEQTPLIGEVISSDSDIPFGNIIDIADGHILFSSYYTNHAFKVYRIENNNLVESGQFLKYGEGPFEMAQPYSFYDKLKNQIYIYDYNGRLGKVYSIELHPIENLYNTSKWEEIQIPVIQDYFLGNSMRKMDDDSFVILGSKVRSNKLLSKIDLDNNTIFELNHSYPEMDGTFKIDPVVKQGVYFNGVIEKHPYSNRLVYACGSGKYAGIIDFDPITSTIKNTSIFTIYPKYTTTDGLNRSYLDDCLRGMQVKVTDEYIYILPSQLTKGDVRRKALYKGYPNYCSDELLVFNWKGELLKKYLLDVPVYSYIVDESDNWLYAVTVELDDEGQIMKKYKLEDLEVSE